MILKPQAIIFDLDGVITDTAHLHFLAWRQVAGEIGIAINEAFNDSLKGISRGESLQRILQYGGKAGSLHLRFAHNWPREKQTVCPFFAPVDGELGIAGNT